MPHPANSLLASDFDGTMFQTFEPSPEGIGVNEAYESAVARVLGEGALNSYQQSGGHKNRTPREIVQYLTDPEGNEGVPRTFEQAFERLMPVDMSIARKTEDLIEAKLEALTGQIGKALPSGERWPRPVPGFMEAWRQVSEGSPNTAIISAGHRDFILRSLDLYDLPTPDIMVSDDEIRAAFSDVPQEMRSKPNPFPMEMAAEQWYSIHGCRVNDSPWHAERILYVGDDIAKDGGLAANVGSNFVHIDPKNPAGSWYDALDVMNGISYVGE